ncbi:uncharacterized protein MONOS_10033 [Monocercomonoides exilis]|uniref:uncharacterized protein n=1 Tax=Monocercomonoides exilis TaxID=2049356 RepID=UPI00355A6D53|nr:hypothetical protein MONOS_10033 [Monocercomonoides exilis]|eukprot:MONOS_10033.1-p1 / transcript=MONOS_10033.1 / gene=MONOS_10033 / organism=Monocercomonoides_exilis_PA203 / gene_product=unspecified product / transcript_product=unspecified product / location=Mono_scaffold00438:32061-38847(-) / protein_length=2181 / sequence_SO=supercontig / SO=protein_coding / is_pseudo=false
MSRIDSQVVAKNSSLSVVLVQIRCPQKSAASLNCIPHLTVIGSLLEMKDCQVILSSCENNSPFACTGGSLGLCNLTLGIDDPKHFVESLVCPIPSSLLPGGSISIGFSSFESFFVGSSAPFVGGAYFSEIIIEDCFFCNMSSVAIRKKPRLFELEPNSNFLEGCEFTDCEQPFYGVIVGGLPEKSFLFRNSSFIKSREIFTNQNYSVSGKSFSNDNITFVDCNFTKCCSVHGGAITVSGNSKLNVASCNFAECYDTFNQNYGYGGAIYCSGSDCELRSSTFNKCSGKGQSSIGGALTHVTSGFSTIIKCSFNSCSAAYGGAVAWYMGGSGSVYDSDFEGSKATLKYAGTLMMINVKTTMKISNCSIAGGTSQLGAGGIDAGMNGYYASFSFAYCLFQRNSVNYVYHAADVFFGKYFSAASAQNSLQFCFSLSTFKNRVVLCNEYAEDCGYGAPYNQWLPHALENIFVKNAGSDKVACGGIGNECKTVKYGITSWNYYMNNSVIVAGELFEEEALDIEWKKIRVSGSEDGSTILKCLYSSTKEGWINIGNGTLELSKASVVCVSNRSAAIVGKDGSLVLEQCSIAKDSECQNPSMRSLLKIEGGTNGTDTCGGALYVRLQERGGLIMNQTAFCGCMAGVEEEKKGKGGGIFVDCRKTDSFVFSDLKFESCDAFAGKNMFMFSNDLNQSVCADRFVFDVRETEKEKNLFVGNDTTKTDFDLRRFLIFYDNETIYVSSSGWDVLRCGSEEEPCMNLYYGKMHFPSKQEVPDGETRTFQIIGEVMINCEADVSDIAIVGSLGEERSALMRFCAVVEAKAGKTEKGESVFVNEKVSVFGGMEICCEFGSEWSQTKLICTRGERFEINDCSFVRSSSDELVYSIVECLSGKCELIDCSMKLQKCREWVVSFAEGSQMVLSNVSMADIELLGKSAFAVVAQTREVGNNEEETGSLMMEKCIFNKVHQNGGTESSVLMSVGSAVAIVSVLNTSMKGCGNTDSERGGAMLIRMNERVEFSCCFSKITECFCSESGRGGGVYLDCESAADALLPFLFENVTLQGNRGYRGRDVYVKCQDLDQQIGEKQFKLDFRAPFEKDLAIWGCTKENDEDEEDLLLRVMTWQSETIFVAAEAANSSDSQQCGTTDEPCISLNIGLAHIVPSVFSNLLVDKECKITGEGSATDVTIKSMEPDGERSVVLVNQSVERAESCLLICSSRVKIEYLAFVIGRMFSSEHQSLICLKDGVLSVVDISFAGEEKFEGEEAISMKCSMVKVNKGKLVMSDCSISSLVICSSVFVSDQGSGINLRNVSCSSIESMQLMRLNDVEKVALQDMNVSNCIFDECLAEMCCCASCEAERISVAKVECKKGMISLKASEAGSKSQISIRFWTVTDVEVDEGSLISVDEEWSGVEIGDMHATNVILSNGCGIDIVATDVELMVKQTSFMNVSRTSAGPCFLSSGRPAKSAVIELCSFVGCESPSVQGSIIDVYEAKELRIVSSVFGASEIKKNDCESGNKGEEVCQWNGSVLQFSNCSSEMKDTTVANSSKGGVTISGGSMKMEEGKFVGNNPLIDKYPSARRNMICEGFAELNIVSLKGGDGLERNSSMWILDKDCKTTGIADERDSLLFIPKLEAIETKKNGEKMQLTFKGLLFLPCNLSFSVCSSVGDVEIKDSFQFEDDDFISENEVQGVISETIINDAADDAEVSVSILFGNSRNPASTDLFILKNKSKVQTDGNDNLAKSGKDGKSSWALIGCIVIVVILFILLIVFVVRWRKQKRRTKELEVIVNDTVRKDPKLIEMATMEMSPEEQWRRAEREAEKKNEEKIKKRVYEKSLGHSESSEHLLSESDSTEYILGRDSDKIPEWMLEKVEKEEEEEVRKGSPSPSISSTSTTDSDSTFVRGEDLCPTTSSMSNLVDAMACSSPHEKLIVDLRDSMFMLLHGRNKTKEMAIGTLQEREQTAAQILFWVANLALHSFDEMNNPLQSLANLSPHIVLFSEHMVICIALHSDCSSDDSDSSSISSSSTIVTSSSDCSCTNKNCRDSPPPSSAFEDDDDNRKECMRWKAPELMMNKNMGATKESVAFSIGIMLWECLTLQIPFGEYEAEVAGKKIVNGERPEMGMAEESTLGGVLKNCMLQTPSERPSLVILKREFIQRFPAGAVVMTVSDAVDIDDETGDCEESNFSSLIEQ